MKSIPIIRWDGSITGVYNAFVAACQCSAEGSRYTSCDQVSGQCVCLPGVVGLRCDSCAHGSYGFPSCRGKNTHMHGVNTVCVSVWHGREVWQLQLMWSTAHKHTGRLNRIWGRVFRRQKECLKLILHSHDVGRRRKIIKTFCSAKVATSTASHTEDVCFVSYL